MSLLDWNVLELEEARIHEDEQIVQAFQNELDFELELNQLEMNIGADIFRSTNTTIEQDGQHFLQHGYRSELEENVDVTMIHGWPNQNTMKWMEYGPFSQDMTAEDLLNGSSSSKIDRNSMKDSNFKTNDRQTFHNNNNQAVNRELDYSVNDENVNSMNRMEDISIENLQSLTTLNQIEGNYQQRYQQKEVLLLQNSSFVTNSSLSRGPISQLPPKYFRQVESSPHKRRVLSRSFSNVSSFTFPRIQTLTCKKKALISNWNNSLVSTAKRKTTNSQSKHNIKQSKVQSKVNGMAMIKNEFAADKMSDVKHILTTKKNAYSSTPMYNRNDGKNMVGVSPMKRKWIITTNKFNLKQNEFDTNLPPRYYSGPRSSPQKKRAHSRTFGSLARSFTFSPNYTK